MPVLNVLAFGITKDLLGSREVALQLPEKEWTAGSFREWLYEEYPKLEQLNALAIAVGNEYADDDTPIDFIQEVALIPPVSGG